MNSFWRYLFNLCGIYENKSVKIDGYLPRRFAATTIYLHLRE